MKVVRGDLTIEAMKEYCDDHDIFVPSRSKRCVYEAAITRAGLHLQIVRLDKKHGCFGYWSDNDMNCATCYYEGECESISLGMRANVYEKKSEHLTSVKFATRLIKKTSQGSQN